MAKLTILEQYKKRHQKKSPEVTKNIRAGIKRYWDGYYAEIEKMKTEGALDGFLNEEEVTNG